MPLIKKVITNKAGHRQTVYVRADPEPGSGMAARKRMIEEARQGSAEQASASSKAKMEGVETKIAAMKEGSSLRVHDVIVRRLSATMFSVEHAANPDYAKYVRSPQVAATVAENLQFKGEYKDSPARRNIEAYANLQAKSKNPSLTRAARGVARKGHDLRSLSDQADALLVKGPLIKKVITNKAGHRQTVYVRADPEPGSGMAARKRMIEEARKPREEAPSEKELARKKKGEAYKAAMMAAKGVAGKFLNAGKRGLRAAVEAAAERKYASLPPHVQDRVPLASFKTHAFNEALNMRAAHGGVRKGHDLRSPSDQADALLKAGRSRSDVGSYIERLKAKQSGGSDPKSASKPASKPVPTTGGSRSHLVRKQITDKRGHRKTVLVNPENEKEKISQEHHDRFVKQVQERVVRRAKGRKAKNAARKTISPHSTGGYRRLDDRWGGDAMDYVQYPEHTSRPFASVPTHMADDPNHADWDTLTSWGPESVRNGLGEGRDLTYQIFVPKGTHASAKVRYLASSFAQHHQRDVEVRKDGTLAVRSTRNGREVGAPTGLARKELHSHELSHEDFRKQQEKRREQMSNLDDLPVGQKFWL